MTATRRYSRKGDKPEGVLFYGGPFSSFVGGPFVIPVSKYVVIHAQSVEHFFQAMKATTLKDMAWVLEAGTPAEAKRRGRKIKLREDWELVKYVVMGRGQRVKFADPVFRNHLVATGQQHIYENSPTDFEWGIRDGKGGFTGKNLLGKLLEEIREEIRASSD